MSGRGGDQLEGAGPDVENGYAAAGCRAGFDLERQPVASRRPRQGTPLARQEREPPDLTGGEQEEPDLRPRARIGEEGDLATIGRPGRSPARDARKHLPLPTVRAQLHHVQLALLLVRLRIGRDDEIGDGPAAGRDPRLAHRADRGEVVDIEAQDAKSYPRL